MNNENEILEFLNKNGLTKKEFFLMNTLPEKGNWQMN